jgi:hypothetical protein
MTDTLMAALLSLPGKCLEFPTQPEPKTGEDFEVVVVDPLSGDATQFAITQET